MMYDDTVRGMEYETPVRRLLRMDMSWSNYPSLVLQSESKVLHGAAHTDADADAMSDIRYRHWTVVSAALVYTIVVAYCGP